MAVKRKFSGRSVSLPAGVAIGVIVSIAMMMLGALTLSYLVVKETVPMDSIGIGTAVILLISSALGPCIASALTKQKKLLVCGFSALIFYLVLLSITAVFFDGVFAGMGLTAMMILLGVGVTLLLGLRKKSGKSKVKIPAYR